MREIGSSERRWRRATHYGPGVDSQLQWTELWQAEAISALEPYVNSKYIVELLVDDPATAIFGTAFGGYIYTEEGGDLRVIHDRSGRSDVYPGPLLRGPVYESRFGSREATQSAVRAPRVDASQLAPNARSGVPVQVRTRAQNRGYTGNRRGARDRQIWRVTHSSSGGGHLAATRVSRGGSNSLRLS